MVGLAHKFTFASPQITAKAVSAVAMPELARQYKVLGTPHTVLNGMHHLVGRLSQAQLLNAVSQFAGASPASP